jgi:hypothetical protein
MVGVDSGQGIAIVRLRKLFLRYWVSGKARRVIQVSFAASTS